jgi:nucleotide-binding universal stress UspA family protein
VKKILVATDLSELARDVARYAFDLREVFGASVYLLHVIETPQAIEFAIAHGQFAHTIEKMKEWGDRQLQGLIPKEFVDDPQVFRIVERGPASKQIAIVARSIGADLTLLGRYRHGSAHTHLLGTTTNRILTNAEGPVLTLKI